MKRVLIKRPKRITELLKETQAEFERRGLQLTIDQVHCLHDLIYWQSLEVEEAVDKMMEYCSIIE